MGKYILLFFTFVLSLTLVACNSNKTEPNTVPENNKTTFQATITEIHESIYFVEPLAGSPELNSSDKIEVSTDTLTSNLNPQVGDIIEITYNGEILETYPARLAEVYTIKVIEEEKTEEIDEKPETTATERETTSPEESSTDWGISLSAENVTPLGMTFIISQSDGNSTGELSFGSDYQLKVWNHDSWETVPYIADNIGWTEEAYYVVMDGIVKQELTWEHFYGSLPKGKYLLMKEFTDFRGTGDYDTAIYSLEFEIE